MDNSGKMTVNQIIRVLHRNIGFFLLGFVLIYAFSGIVLIYRDSDFLKQERIAKVSLPVETKPAELGQALRMREFRILKTEGDVIFFQGGSYNSKTGMAEYTVKELVFPFNKFTNLHKTASKNPFHWFTLVFGILLTFLAVSSIWMFNSKSRLFRRGMYTVLAGFVFAVLLILFLK
jgi:hypothetical protein